MKCLALARGVRSSGALWIALAMVMGAVAGCEDDGPEGNEARSCGDGVCEPVHCETPVRCPDDCGACVGAECTPGAGIGACGEPCVSSCECGNAGEVCEADYGIHPGVCVPVGCLGCLAGCSYTPDADGVCSDPTCDD